MGARRWRSPWEVGPMRAIILGILAGLSLIFAVCMHLAIRAPR